MENDAAMTLAEGVRLAHELDAFLRETGVTG
jgi:hypothetical protein